MDATSVEGIQTAAGRYAISDGCFTAHDEDGSATFPLVNVKMIETTPVEDWEKIQDEWDEAQREKQEREALERRARRMAGRRAYSA